LANHHSNSQKKRCLEDGKCKQVPHFEMSARCCRSECFILKGCYVWEDQKYTAKRQGPENERGLQERTIGLTLLFRRTHGCSLLPRQQDRIAIQYH
jgi:hypothetical protein